MEYVIRDAVWETKAKELMECANLRKKYADMEEKLKESLIKLSEGKSSRSGMFVFTKSDRKGTVQWELIPEIKLVDLEQYRKEPIESWRLTLELESNG